MIPVQLATTLRKIVESLHRLVGGYIQPENFQKVENDAAFNVDGAVLVRFTNRGQTAVLIDNELLMPGEGSQPGDSFTEGDTAGPGLKHKYRIEFLTTFPKNTAIPDAGDADPPFKYPGNYLEIRVIRRNLGPLA